MAKQGGGIARFTSFFGVAEYERDSESRRREGVEDAFSSVSSDESTTRLNALPAPMGGGSVRPHGKRPVPVLAEQEYEKPAEDYWEDKAVHNTVDENYTQDQYDYNDGGEIAAYSDGYDDYDGIDGYIDEEEDELRRITTIHPRSYNDAKIIGEAFREDIPVIMNVDDMPDTDAKRLVDFASGLVFALNGRIERVTAQVFLLTPTNLEVLGMNSADVPQEFENEGLVPFDQG